MGATPDVRVYAQGQPFFLATEPVFPAPPLAAGGANLQVEAPTIESFHVVTGKVTI